MNSFTPKTVIKSAELNANFTGLADGTEIQAGAITSDKLSTTVAFLVKRTTNQTITTGTATRVDLATETFDIGNNYDSTTNYQFIAPYDGIYHFSGSVKIDAPGIATSIYIRVNSVVVAQATNYTNLVTDDITTVTSITVQLSTGDDVELWCAHFAGASRSLLGTSPAENFFSGYLVGTT